MYFSDGISIKFTSCIINCPICETTTLDCFPWHPVRNSFLPPPSPISGPGHNKEENKWQLLIMYNKQQMITWNATKAYSKKGCIERGKCCKISLNCFKMPFCIMCLKRILLRYLVSFPIFKIHHIFIISIAGC